MINLECFKDKIFHLLNEENTMDIRDIETNDKEDTFQIFFEDGSAFEIECHQILQKEQPAKNQIHITEEEKKNCQKVIEFFSDLRKNMWINSNLIFTLKIIHRLFPNVLHN